MPVYFIATQQFVKIGTSDHPVKRFSNIQSCNPTELKIIALIPGGQDVEQYLHCRFASKRERGEWYKIDSEILSFIDSAQALFHDYAEGIMRVENARQEMSAHRVEKQRIETMALEMANACGVKVVS